MSQEAIRAFVAIPLPEYCIGELQSLQNRLRELVPNAVRDAVRWVHPHQIHLTLKFLGDVTTNEIDDLAVALQTACTGWPGFRLALSGTGCFPDFKRPRVIWTGISGDIEPLLQLQARIEHDLSSFGEKQEVRAFRPHLTLARIQTRNARLARRIGEVVAQAEYSISGEWQVMQVLLIQSRLLPTGSEYFELASINL